MSKRPLSSKMIEALKLMGQGWSMYKFFGSGGKVWLKELGTVKRGGYCEVRLSTWGALFHRGYVERATNTAPVNTYVLTESGQLKARELLVGSVTSQPVTTEDTDALLPVENEGNLG